MRKRHYFVLDFLILSPPPPPPPFLSLSASQCVCVCVCVFLSLSLSLSVCVGGRGAKNVFLSSHTSLKLACFIICHGRYGMAYFSFNRQSLKSFGVYPTSCSSTARLCCDELVTDGLTGRKKSKESNPHLVSV